MKLSCEQVEFIRRHGVTRCPPAMVIPMDWGPRPRQNGLAELTEQDNIRRMIREASNLADDWKLEKRAARPKI